MLVDSLMRAARGVRSARWTITDDLRSRSLQAASSSADHLSVRCRSTNPNAQIPFLGLMPLTTTGDVCVLVGMKAVKAAFIATVIKSRTRRTDTRGSRASTFGLVRRNQFAILLSAAQNETRAAANRHSCAPGHGPNWTPAGIYCARHNAGKSWGANGRIAQYLGNRLPAAVSRQLLKLNAAAATCDQ